MKEQASQTLFRFVSFRAPELIAPQRPSRKFIYEMIDDGRQSRVREISDGTFEERSSGLTILTQDQIRAKNVGLHDFGAWIQKNRRDFDYVEVRTKLQEVLTDSEIANEEAVWLNLYHQYKTQTDHGARESLINLIIAKNLLDESKKIDRNTPEEELLKLYKEIANARIVIPNDIIDVVQTVDTNPATPIFRTANAATASRIASNIATYKLEELQLAKATLKDLEKQYRRDYDTAYDTAFKAHNATVKLLTDQYDEDLKREQETWYRSRTESLKSPREEEFLFSKISKTKFPDLPSFDFTFRPELDETEAKRSMPENLFTILSRLNSVSFPDTFEEAYGLLSNEEVRLSEIQIANKRLSSKRVSLNGTIINEVAGRNLSNEICYELTLRAETSPITNDNKWYWQYAIDLLGNDREVDIDAMSYTLTFSGGNELSDTIFLGATETGVFERTVFIFPQAGGLEFDHDDGVPTLSGTITLVNGDQLSFDRKVNPNTSVSRQYSCREIDGNGGGDPDPDIGDDNDKEEPFIPSGFGMRQLGIADYRRVEQNVHCYVEGEVSHIENVMAREYKEKSTRRLRRSENTTSTTSETEKEELTDTSTTDRFEMQNEVAQVISESTSIDAFANVSGGNDLIQFNTGAGFANNTSQEDSISQAVTQAQEITSRAMDRVVQKIKEERITKIVEEYEENNRHGFDNREGDKHVVGVYRWIDKVYKNQIYNYGKRLMYEFFIPEPSRLHRLALTEIIQGDQGTTLEKPIDPRTEGLLNPNYLHRSTYRAWAGKYNATVAAPPDEIISFSAASSDNGASGNYLVEHKHSGGNNWTVEVPENYEVYDFEGTFGFTFVHSQHENTNGTLLVGQRRYSITNNPKHENLNIYGNSFPKMRNEIGLSFHGGDVGGMSWSLRFNASLTEEAYESWRNETFNAIITAYEEKLAQYNEQLVEETASITVLRDSNPLFYRQIEQTVLRKNCVSYLIDRDQDGERTYGKSGLYQGSTLEDAEVKLNQRLDNYTAFATFLEQAIEWDIMSYNFYPFYWANRSKWGDLYDYENDDPTFRKFMQAGMARVVVTVRPGFENAMMHYMATGNVWDGGELPVLDDPLYLSIVEELQQPLGIKEGEAWKTQVPTSLTILQADSLGLKVDKALPCNCEDESDFQESDQTGCNSGIVNDPTVFGGGSEKPLVQFSLRHFYDKSTIGDIDTAGGFPRIFRCQGQTIGISRDASWAKTDSVALVYQALAERLSLIPGITASQFDYLNPREIKNGSAVLFTVDFNVVDVFGFEKEGYAEPNGLDRIMATSDGETVKLTYGDAEFGMYIASENRLADSEGTILSYEEIQDALPVSRFIPQDALTN